MHVAYPQRSANRRHSVHSLWIVCILSEPVMSTAQCSTGNAVNAAEAWTALRLVPCKNQWSGWSTNFVRRWYFVRSLRTYRIPLYDDCISATTQSHVFAWKLWRGRCRTSSSCNQRFSTTTRSLLATEIQRCRYVGVSVTHSFVLSFVKKVIRHSPKVERILHTKTELRRIGSHSGRTLVEEQYSWRFLTSIWTMPLHPRQVRKTAVCPDQTFVTGLSVDQKAWDRGSGPMLTLNLRGRLSR